MDGRTVTEWRILACLSWVWVHCVVEMREWWVRGGCMLCACVVELVVWEVCSRLLWNLNVTGHSRRS